jgi:hyperosmotically inducible periplasmic protein
MADPVAHGVAFTVKRESSRKQKGNEMKRNISKNWALALAGVVVLGMGLAVQAEEAEGLEVTLEGEAVDLEQLESAIQDSADIDGVTVVKDEMTVAAPPPADLRTMGDKFDDVTIVAKAKAELMTHRSTSALQTAVESHNGEVTLTGVAQSESEKELAGKLVADINGVTGVKNEMTVEEVVVD